MIKVSVIIPNFNRESLIGETIENMLSQTLQPQEIIVVDDGSTDSSVEVIKSFGSRITLICQENKGPGAARNAGLEIATGDYIQFFDSDDLCTLNKLESQANALATSGSDIAYSPWAKLCINSKQIKFENHVIQQKQLPNRVSPLMWLLRGWAIIFQACMFRHSFLRKIGKYRTDLMPSEDSEFLFRMLLNQAKLQFVPDCLVLYRLHSMGQITDSGTSQVQRTNDWLKYCHLVENQLLENNIKIDSTTSLKFQTLVWQSKKRYQDISSSSMPVIHPLNYKTDNLAELIYKTNITLQLIEGKLRAWLRGAGYPYFYQSSPPSEYQYQLIRNMGYSVNK
jgi:glycosyltransferase involved in cell wall biosynthesis